MNRAQNWALRTTTWYCCTNRDKRAYAVIDLKPLEVIRDLNNTWLFSVCLDGITKVHQNSCRLYQACRKSLFLPLNLSTQTNHFSCFKVLIAFSCFAVLSPPLSLSTRTQRLVLITTQCSGNQNTPPAAPGEAQRRGAASRVADAYYRFPLWPRKPLIASADAARHLTTRCGERDDWLQHTLTREAALSRVRVYVCGGSVRAHGVECVIIILREKVAALICLIFPLGLAMCSWFSQEWLLHLLAVLQWTFSNVMQKCCGCNA